MVLLDPIVQTLVGPMFHAFVLFSPDRARVTVMTIRRDTCGNDAGHGFGRSKECLRRLRVAVLAHPDVDKGTETISGTIKVAPAAAHLDVCLINVPTLSDPTLAPPPEVVDQRWRQLLKMPAWRGDPKNLRQSLCPGPMSLSQRQKSQMARWWRNVLVSGKMG
jgi:hypothetical protein